jgi:hypothetical protein
VRAALPANLQATWDSHVADYNASAAEQAGASAAVALATGHFDNSLAVHAFSGAVAAVPIVGPIMSGLTEFFYANGAAIGNAFGNLFGLAHCNKDVRTPQQWMAGAKVAPAAGTFASVVVPMLAVAWADYVACNEGASGIPWKPCTQILPAAVGAWNAIATGATVDYFVPQLNSPDCSFLNLMVGTHTDSGFLVNANQGPCAFLPLSKVPSSMQNGENLFWARIKAKAGPVGMTADQAAAWAQSVVAQVKASTPAPRKVIPLKLGPSSTAAKAAAPAAKPMSTGAKVAVGAAAVGGASLLAWLAVNGWKWVTPRFARALLAR